MLVCRMIFMIFPNQNHLLNYITYSVADLHGGRCQHGVSKVIYFRFNIRSKKQITEGGDILGPM